MATRALSMEPVLVMPNPTLDTHTPGTIMHTGMQVDTSRWKEMRRCHKQSAKQQRELGRGGEGGGGAAYTPLAAAGGDLRRQVRSIGCPGTRGRG
jgi:hypothetical protein